MSAKYCAKASAAFRSLQQLLRVQKKGGVVKMIGFTMLDRSLLFTSSVQLLPYPRNCDTSHVSNHPNQPEAY